MRRDKILKMRMLFIMLVVGILCYNPCFYGIKFMPLFLQMENPSRIAHIVCLSISVSLMNCAAPPAHMIPADSPAAMA